MKTEVLEVQKLTKRYGNHIALDALSFQLYHGELLGITGTNSSGIEDLLEILTGCILPDNGRILLYGQPLLYNSIYDIQSRGIFVISPDTSLLQNLTVEENIGLSWITRSRKILIRKSVMRFQAMELLHKYHADLDLTAPAESLSAYEKSLLEILIARLRNARIIILHDIIRNLSKQEWLNLLTIIDTLRKEGISFIVTCYDYRMLKITDRILVFRNGHTAGIFYKNEFDFYKIYKTMTQKSLTVASLPALDPQAPELFRGVDIIFQGLCEPLNFSMKCGEIIGFVSADHEVRYEPIQLFNGEIPYAGQIFLSGKPITITDRASSMENGICCIRKFGSAEFFFPNLSVSENILLAKYREFSSFGILNTKMCRFAIQEYENLFDKNGDDWCKLPEEILPQLRFKLFLNKWFTLKPKLILMDNLFAEADINMQDSIYEFVSRARRQGIGMICYSTVYTDIREICDRIYQIP